MFQDWTHTRGSDDIHNPIILMEQTRTHYVWLLQLAISGLSRRLINNSWLVYKVRQSL